MMLEVRQHFEKKTKFILISINAKQNRERSEERERDQIKRKQQPTTTLSQFLFLLLASLFNLLFIFNGDLQQKAKRKEGGICI